MRDRSGLSAPALLVLFLTTAPATQARKDQILILGNPAGAQTVAERAGATRAEYSFNDRGRGDHIIATWKLDDAGVPIDYCGSGNDYVKAVGVIAPGKLADLILVDGDPSARIADLNKVTLVMKGGRIYDPARIEQALSIAPPAPL